MNQSNGLRWLDGKKWADVTRDERFFCAVLYEHARKNPADFAQWLIKESGLNTSSSGTWDLGFEVCFYRDYLWMKKESVVAWELPPKRTFDLCLFGEKAIIIIEAKVCEPFDYGQNGDFSNDEAFVNKLPGLENLDVFTVALATSKYFENAKKHGRSGTLSVFKENHITWAKVSEKFRDPLLPCADKMYKLKPGQLINE